MFKYLSSALDSGTQRVTLHLISRLILGISHKREAVTTIRKYSGVSARGGRTWSNCQNRTTVLQVTRAVLLNDDTTFKRSRKFKRIKLLGLWNWSRCRIHNYRQDRLQQQGRRGSLNEDEAVIIVMVPDLYGLRWISSIGWWFNHSFDPKWNVSVLIDHVLALTSSITRWMWTTKPVSTSWSTPLPLPRSSLVTAIVIDL